MWVERLHVFCYVGILTILWSVSLEPRWSIAQVIDLRYQAQATLYGGRYKPPPDSFSPATGDFHAWSLAAGDIDGDGYEDILSAAIFADGPADTRFSSGDAYVVFGKPRQTIDSLLDLTQDADITIYGARGGDNLGWVSACGDVDGDGFDDMLFSAIHSDGPDSARFEAGEIYLIYGGPRSEMTEVFDLRARDPDVRITGIGHPILHLGGDAFDGFEGDTDAIGLGLEVGDINGDGRADVLFSIVRGGGRNRGERVASGTVYVLLGKERCDLPAFVDCDLGSSFPHPDIVIHGADAGDMLGFDLACGDLDGDGMDEILASAYHGDGPNNSVHSAGDIYVLWGRRSWRHDYDLAREQFDFAINGSLGYHAGYRMSLGDLDGDGLDDLIVGSPVNHDFDSLPDGRSGAGEYRISFGRSRQGWDRWNSLITMTDVLLLGADTLDPQTSDLLFVFAFSLATGSRNEDAYEDLVIGVGGGDGPREGRRNAGEVYLLFGRPRWEWAPFYDLREGYDVIIYGAEGVDQGVGIRTQDALGWGSMLVDIDGNGVDEIVLSAPFADGPDDFRPDCGEIQVVFDNDTSLVLAEQPDHPQPPGVSLFPSFPNPFRASSTLCFSAPIGSVASISVYDARGALVAIPLRAQRMGCENLEVTWRGTNQHGRKLPAGVYFLRLKVDGTVRTGKLTLVR
jgi:hypothetical protein